MSPLWRAIPCLLLLSACFNRNSFAPVKGVLSANPDALPADNTFTAQVLVVISDYQRQGVRGVLVELSADSPTTHVQQPEPTDANGTCTGLVRSVTPGVVTLSAMAKNGSAAGQLLGSLAVTFYPVGGGTPATATLSANPNQAAANGSSVVSLTAAVQDALGLPVVGKLVTLSSTGSANVFTTPSGSTDASGKFATTVTSTAAETKQITAAVAGLDAHVSVVFSAGSATHIALNGLTGGAAKVVSSPTVTALDAYNNVATGYTGVVTWTSTDPAASLPGAFTFSATDAGSHQFTNGVTLQTPGIQSVTVLDTVNALNATDPNLVITPGHTTVLAVTGIRTALSVGELASVTVTAYDAVGNKTPAYTGTVHFTSTDGAALLPSDHTFTGVDAGSFTTSITMESLGTQTVSVSDAANGLNGNETGIVVTLYTVQALAMGEDQDGTCALLSNNQVKCWGLNLNGELGYGDTQSRGAAAGQMGSALPFVNLGAGRSAQAVTNNCSDGNNGHTCALLDDGTMKCWGANGWGQLGYGDTLPRSTPSSGVVPLGAGRTAVRITTSCDASCALLDTQAITCWGHNAYGELGLGDTNDRSQPAATPINLGAGRTAQNVTAGAFSVCAQLDTAQINCWGYNQHGELGLGDTTNRTDPSALTPINLGGGRSAKSIGASSCTTCALLDTNNVTCWGCNAFGEAGLGDTLERDSPPASTITLAAPAQQLTGGVHTVCATLSDGRVQCWGSNAHGNLGVGDTVDRYVPGPVAQLGTGRAAISVLAGNLSVCALLDTRMVKCWGANFDGELGLGDSTQRGDTLTTLGDALPTLSLW